MSGRGEMVEAKGGFDDMTMVMMCMFVDGRVVSCGFRGCIG